MTLPGPTEGIVFPAFSQTRSAFVELIAQRSAIVDKSDLVLRECRGRSVLDIGCINHSAENALVMGATWLHHQIMQVASSLTGLDLLEQDARRLNEEGYNIMPGDAQRFDLKRQFDVIVAADVIEHLSDLGGFLASAKRHMHAESRLVVTTPNPFAFAQMMQVLFNGRAVVNAQHTVWLDPSVAYELLDRAGFAVVDFAWIDSDPHYRPTSTATRALTLAARRIGRVRPAVRDNYALVVRKAAS